jgi:metal-responsive CopG/Arc/MetJ family transcriptional regulator
MSTGVPIHINLPKKLADRAEFFMKIGGYENKEEFCRDAVRRFIEFKEQTTDEWLMEHEALVAEIPESKKSEKELITQIKNIRDEIWREKYAKKYANCSGQQ